MKVIDCYLSLLQQWDKELGGNSIFLPTQFLRIRVDMKEIVTFSKSKELNMETKFVLAPILINDNHWVMVIVDIKKECLNFFNSMGGPWAQECNIICDWLHLLLPTVTWSTNIMSQTIRDFPLQTGNTTECGIFVMMYADYFLEDLVMNFTLRDMPHFRIKIFADIFRGRLKYV